MVGAIEGTYVVLQDNVSRVAINRNGQHENSLLESSPA